MKLKKFRKNGKQKGIAIGVVIGIILLIGGITLYRTFALYKEEKTFNVLRGVVPDFTHVTTTYNVNGKTDTKPPTKSNIYNVSVNCDGAKGTWNSSSWELEVTNKTKKEIICTVTFTNKSLYKDTILNGADPVLSGDLVAVKVDPSTGVVTKADTYSEWYNYTKKEWANAIIPTDDAKNVVQSLSEGQTIDESQIESYFVWIPYYKIQKIVDLGNGEKAFEIEFDTFINSVNDGCPLYNEIREKINENEIGNLNCKFYFLDFLNDSYHYFFNGLWVGKFETGHKSGSVSSDIGRYGDSLQNELIIKPNSYAWTNTNVSTIYQLGQNYQRYLDSHMMKNSEWELVEYLTQSIYGKCTKKGEDITCEEVERNNNSRNVTGYAVVNSEETSKNYEEADPGKDGTGGKTINYNNHESVKASTTGNYTGIFDMAGGTSEYMMSVIFTNAILRKSGTPTCASEIAEAWDMWVPSGLTEVNMPIVSGGNSTYEEGSDFRGISGNRINYSLSCPGYSFDLNFDSQNNQKYFDRLYAYVDGGFSGTEKIVVSSIQLDLISDSRNIYRENPSKNTPWTLRGGDVGKAHNRIFSFAGANGEGSANYGFRIAIFPH